MHKNKTSGELVAQYMDYEKLNNYLGWKPKFKFSNTLPDLFNWYKNGSQKMGWHSDNESELGYNPQIASLSLGAERRFDLKHKKNKENTDERTSTVTNHTKKIISVMSGKWNNCINLAKNINYVL